ncbi:uncharacterized protein LOC122371977 [Amphibalanus amphitrite]|uniref:uncharacterized protein LOC122371977 n=1 Tax=Amphibalanus amphitrite TaxID=1232801 RepID=UPI001C912434|nr:uncharacterized protein LOC122371977 [Amphibalanus amphitrite]
MDEAPVTRYNVQNLVPANGFLASSPITDAVGGHGALYQANTVGAQHASAGRRILLSEPVLGPLDGWSSKIKDDGTSLPSTHTGHQMPPWFTAGGQGTWTEIYNGSISRGDKPVTQEQQTRTEDVPGRRRGQTRLPSLPKSDTRPASAMAPSRPPVADQHVTRKPLLSADQVLSDEPAVTGLLSQNVSAAIWTDLVGGGDSVPAPPGDPPLEPLVSRLTQLGSQFVQGEPAPPQAGLPEQLLWLRDRLGQLDGPDALDVVVGVGANLVASHLDNAGTRRRAGGDLHEPVCRCPESSVTPGVLAALTSLLALLIYAGSLATVAATSGTTTATSTSTATARSRSSPASLPGLRPMSTLLLRWLDGTVSPDRCHSAGLCRPHRLGTGRRLEQLGVPINVRKRRPGADSRRDGRLTWPELFDSLASGTTTTTAPARETGHTARPVGRSGHRDGVTQKSVLVTEDPGVDHSSGQGGIDGGEHVDPPVSKQKEKLNGTTAKSAESVPVLWQTAGQSSTDRLLETSPVQPIKLRPAQRRHPVESRPVQRRSHTESRPAQRHPSAEPQPAQRRPLAEPRPAQRRHPAASHRRWPSLGRLLAWLGRRQPSLAQTVRRGQRLVLVSRQTARARQMGISANHTTSSRSYPSGEMVLHPRGMVHTLRVRAPLRQKPRLGAVLPHWRRAGTSRQKGARANVMAPRSTGHRPLIPPHRSQPMSRLRGSSRRRRPRKQTARTTTRVQGQVPAVSTAKGDIQKNNKNDTAMPYSQIRNQTTNKAQTKIASKGQQKAKKKPGLNINLNLSLDNLRAKLKSSFRRKSKPKGHIKSNKKPKTPKPYGKRVMCDCKSNLGDLLGFLPLALLVGYSTSVSTAAAASSGASSGSVTVTINDADTTTIANTNSPTLTNTDNDVITTAANANPVNTNTNTLTNNDNDVITNTNTATNNGRSASAPRTAAVVRTLLSLVSARSWRHEPCFQRRLCDLVASSGADRPLLAIASVPVSLLLSSHRGGRFDEYQRLFSAGLGGTCPTELAETCHQPAGMTGRQPAIDKLHQSNGERRVSDDPPPKTSQL